MKSVEFEGAIRETRNLLEDWEQDEISDEELRLRLNDLLTTSAGARGVLVSLLTGSWSFDDAIPEPIVSSFKRSSEVADELIAKNLLMSTCMTVHHGREGNVDNERGSRTVQRRCFSLIDELRTESLRAKLVALRNASKAAIDDEQTVEGDTADFLSFLKKWNYDSEQLTEALGALERVLRDTYSSTD